MSKIDVLDHGYVRLVSYMQPAVRPEEWESLEEGVPNPKNWSGDLEIVRNARTSYNADWRSAPQDDRDSEDPEDRKGKDEKLIHYLMAHDHSTPFEAMVFTFEVQAPIFVFRQWHRHRTWSYNEVSARYTELPEIFYVPKPEHIGEQSKTNKQGRVLEVSDPAGAQLASEYIQQCSEHCHIVYQQLLRRGVPRELARLVLPLNTYSRMFATVDLHNLFHFLELRLDAHAQYEIRVYADALLRLVEPICPVACQAFRNKADYQGENNEDKR